MDKASALLRRAADVWRLIFASLPWKVRFAHVWVLVAGDEALFDAWGRAIGASMLNAGIKDMPDPGEAWAKHPGDARRLPHGYMADFVAGIYRTILSQSARDPSVPEEAIALFFRLLTMGKRRIDPAYDFKQAKNYVYKGCVLEGMTIRRKKLREFARQETQQMDEEGNEMSMDINDPHALDEFRKLEKDPHLWKEYMDYLAQHIHPDIPLYLNLRMEGYTNDQIVGAPKKGIMETMLPHYKEQGHPMKSDPTYWGDKFVKRIHDVSMDFLHSKNKTFDELLSAHG